MGVSRDWEAASLQTLCLWSIRPLVCALCLLRTIIRRLSTLPSPLPTLALVTVARTVMGMATGTYMVSAMATACTVLTDIVFPLRLVQR